MTIKTLPLFAVTFAALSFVSLAQQQQIDACNDILSGTLTNLVPENICLLNCSVSGLASTSLNSIGMLTWTRDETTCGSQGDPSLVIDFSGAGMTGPFPTSFDSQDDFDFNLFLQENTLSGTVSSTLKGNPKLLRININNNSLTDTAASFADYHDGIITVNAWGNAMTGNYDDSALVGWLHTAPSLLSVSLEFDGTGCLDLSAINRARGEQDPPLPDLQVLNLPESAECPRTPEPTPPPSTGAPVTPNPTAPTSKPTGVPTSPTTPKPTRGPFTEPTLEPTTGAPTLRPKPTPRPLPEFPGHASSPVPPVLLSLLTVALVAMFNNRAVW